MANPAFYETFQVLDRETQGRKIDELGEGQWDNADLRRTLQQVVPENRELKGFEVIQDFPRMGRKRTVLDAQRIEQEGDRPYLILVSIREIREA